VTPTIFIDAYPVSGKHAGALHTTTSSAIRTMLLPTVIRTTSNITIASIPYDKCHAQNAHRNKRR